MRVRNTDERAGNPETVVNRAELCLWAWVAEDASAVAVGGLGPDCGAVLFVGLVRV